jgi:hypothetical protein
VGDGQEIPHGAKDQPVEQVGKWPPTTSAGIQPGRARPAARTP